MLIDRLLEECRNVRTLVVKSRPSQKIHPDVDRLEEDVRKLRMRWENICSQIIERLAFSDFSGSVLPHYVVTGTSLYIKCKITQIKWICFERPCLIDPGCEAVKLHANSSPSTAMAMMWRRWTSATSRLASATRRLKTSDLLRPS